MRRGARDLARATVVPDDREGEREDMKKRLVYQVSLERLSPVGLVYLWPTTSI